MIITKKNNLPILDVFLKLRHNYYGIVKEYLRFITENQINKKGDVFILKNITLKNIKKYY